MPSGPTRSHSRYRRAARRDRVSELRTPAFDIEWRPMGPPTSSSGVNAITMLPCLMLDSVSVLSIIVMISAMPDLSSDPSRVVPSAVRMSSPIDSSDPILRDRDDLTFVVR